MRYEEEYSDSFFITEPTNGSAGGTPTATDVADGGEVTKTEDE